MRGHFYRWGLVLALTTTAFYALRSDTSVPQSVVDSLKLLKKPIEDLLPDLDQTTSTASTDVDLESPLDLDPYQELHNQRERWNEMRSLIESGQPLFTPLPSEEWKSRPRRRAAWLRRFRRRLALRFSCRTNLV